MNLFIIYLMTIQLIYSLNYQIYYLQSQSHLLVLDSESGQSIEESELEDNCLDLFDFIEQNNVEEILQSLIDNVVPVNHCTEVITMYKEYEFVFDVLSDSHS